MARICETTNYKLFAPSKFNRNVINTKNMEASMKKYGWRDPKPMEVVRIENNIGNVIPLFEIIDGHNRFYAARKLGISVKYVEVKPTMVMTPAEDGPTITLWSIQHYLEGYVRLGKPAYIMVKEYHDKTGINLGACISMLAGDSAGSNNWNVRFKGGTYRLGNLSHARVVAAIINQCRESGYPYWHNTLFVRAVSKLAWAEGFASEVLKGKIKTFVHFMEKQASVQGYGEMLDSIYNRQSRERTNVWFLAEEAARKKNAVKAGNQPH